MRKLDIFLHEYGKEPSSKIILFQPEIPCFYFKKFLIQVLFCKNYCFSQCLKLHVSQVRSCLFSSLQIYFIYKSWQYFFLKSYIMVYIFIFGSVVQWYSMWDANSVTGAQFTASAKYHLIFIFGR